MFLHPNILSSSPANTSVSYKASVLKQIFQKILQNLTRAERSRFARLTLSNVLLSVADIVLLSLLLLMVAFYTGTARQATQLLTPWIGSHNPIGAFSILVLLFILKNAFGFVLYRRQSGFFFSVAGRIAGDRLSEYQDSSYEHYVRSEQAHWVNKVNHYPIEFAQNILISIQTLFTESALVFITVLAILIFKPALFLLLLLFLLPPVALSVVFLRKRINHIRKHIREDAEKTHQYLREAFDYFIESKLYGKKSFFAGRYLQYQQHLSGHVSNLLVAQWIPSRLVEIFAVLGLFVLVAFDQLMDGSQSALLDIGAFIAAAYKIMPGIVRMTNAGALLRTYEHVMEKQELPVPAEQQVASDFDTDEIRSVVFEKVSFHYTGNPVLEQVNVTINTGDFLLLSAPSGKGKTTFLNVLLGLLPAQTGRILLNGQPVTMNGLRGLYPQISYVRQQTVLIHDSLLRNITLDEKNVDEDQLTQAITFSGLQPLIDRMDTGLHSMIADEGKNISGGQKQRIALARAVYHRAQMLVMDEPFNELDEASEIQILEQLKQFTLSGGIVVLVSHNSLAQEYCTQLLEL